jgi:hypothetical protein
LKTGSPVEVIVVVKGGGVTVTGAGVSVTGVGTMVVVVTVTHFSAGLVSTSPSMLTVGDRPAANWVAVSAAGSMLGAGDGAAAGGCSDGGTVVSGAGAPGVGVAGGNGSQGGGQG